MRDRRVDGDWLSPSGATACPRKRFLLRMEDYYLEPQSVWPSMTGHAIHAYAELVGKVDSGDEIRETQLSMKVPVPVAIDGDIRTVDVEIRGTLDYYDPEHRRIVDYKTTYRPFIYYDPELKKRVHRELPEEDHVVQTNIYRLLLENAGHPVQEIKICYLRMDRDVPRKVVDVPVWDLQDTYETVMDLAQPLAKSLITGILPPPYGVDDPRAWECRFCPVAEACRRRAESGEERIDG